MAISLKDTVDQPENEKNFLLHALSTNGKRMDGRGPMEMRYIKLSFGRADCEGTAEVQLGQTRVLAVVTAEVVPPFPDRPTEGFLYFNVELSPMACPSVEGGRAATVTAELTRVIERCVRDSQAIDTESLCIIAGEKVWSIRCDIHILNHGGNLIDSTVLATMAALQHFRRPEVTIHPDTNTVQCHSADEKEPHPLSLHHVPLTLTFALLDQGKHTIVDPTDREEAIMGGRISFGLNAHKELCSLHKMGGTPVQPEVLLNCSHLACTKVSELQKLLKNAVREADQKSREAQIQRLQGTAVQADAPPPDTPYATEVASQMEVEATGLNSDFLAFDKLHIAAHVREDPDEAANEEKEQAQQAIFDMISQAAEKSKRSSAEEDKSNGVLEQMLLNSNNDSKESLPSTSSNNVDTSKPVSVESFGPSTKNDNDSEEETEILQSEFKNAERIEVSNGMIASENVDDNNASNKQCQQPEQDDLLSAVRNPKAKKKKKKKKDKQKS